MAQSTTATTTATKVDTPHAEYTRMQSRWKRCRDVMEGGDAVHAAGGEYLPKLKDQPDEEYKVYNARATFFNATWRTIAGYVGMIFRKDPIVKTPDAMKEMLEDVDGTGIPFNAMLKEVTQEVVSPGRVGVLVDMPYVEQPKDAPPLNLADAKAMNLRPRACVYKAENIRNWRTDVVNNQRVPVFVVLEECINTVSPTNEFEEVEEKRWRVLDLTQQGYRQRVYKLKESQAKNEVATYEQVGGDIFPKMNGKPLSYIPFEVLNPDKPGFEVEVPPLIDLVDMNLSHYRTNAIYEQCLAFCPPTMLLVGWQPKDENEKIYVGSRTAITSSRADCKGSFIEYSGQGLSPLEKALDRKETQMAVLGARLLEPQKKAVEAADTAAIHRKGEESALSTMATTISLSMTKVLRWMAEWSGNTSDEVEVTLNTDFFPVPMTPQMLTALVTSWQQGAFSDQTLFDNLKRGEVVGDTVTLEEEQAAILTSPMLAMQQQTTADAGNATSGQPGGDQGNGV